MSKKDFQFVPAPNPGFYVVLVDITNTPLVDRRTRYNWIKAETIKAGTRIQVDTVPLPLILRETADEILAPYEGDDPVVMEKRKVARKILDEHNAVRTVQLVKGGYSDRLNVNHEAYPTHQELWKLIAPHLKVLDDDLGTVLKRYQHQVSWEATLSKLLEDGVLQISQIDAAAKSLQDVEKDEYEALCKRWGV